MEHAVSTAATVFPTTCRNYYDPYQQQSMAPSMKTYTIRNENNRRPKKIDSLNLIRNKPPDFSSNPSVPAVPHSIRQLAPVSATEAVPERRHAPVAAQTDVLKPIPKPIIKQAPAPLKPALKPAPKPVTKPAPVLLTQDNPPHQRREYRRELPLPPRDDPSAEYSPTDPGILNRDLPATPSPRPNPRPVRPRTSETHRDKRANTAKSSSQLASLFSFTCFRSRQKREKPAPSFKVLESRLSEYETHPVPVPPKARQPQMTSHGVPIARYKFLYPRAPVNIPGTAGRNSVPIAKQPKSSHQQQQQEQQQQQRQRQRHSTPPPPPPHPRRVVKRLSDHLSNHPAVKSLMCQYPTVEMFEKRTGFDTYFDSPFVGYSHSYWTALHRPPSPFKRQKPLKVKFDTPASPVSTVETYGDKRDLGDGLHLCDSYSYPYSPEDYGKRFDFGFNRSSVASEQRYQATKPQSDKRAGPRNRRTQGIEREV